MRRSRAPFRRTWTVGIGLALSLTLAQSLPAQSPSARKVAASPAEEAAEGIETEPIRCWWRADKAAVRIGEYLGVVLTCSVVETQKLRVVAQTAELAPTTVELLPFEVIGGRRHEEFGKGLWRYFQFEYVLRLLDDDLFGQEVEVPSLEVTYNIQSSEGGGTEGRDQTYVLPALPIRVLSLVPNDATDIRDAADETFAEIEVRRFRASAAWIGAAVVFGFAVVLLGLAVQRGLRRFRVRAPVDHRVSTVSLLTGCLREIERLKVELGRGGWTASGVASALAVARVAGAIALEHPINQAVAEEHESGREGQLEMRAGILRRRRVLVSASTTTAEIDQRLADANGRKLGERAREGLAKIRTSVAVLSAARYARDPELDANALDEALGEGSDALRQMRLAKLSPRRATLSWLQSRRWRLA